MHRKAVVINIRFGFGDKKLFQFKQSSAAEKWLRIKKRIEECYEECKKTLKDDFDKTKIIFCMHEYAIYDQNLHNKTVRPNILRHIQRQLMEFTQAHPNVAIYLPFAVRYTRHRSHLSRVEKRQQNTLHINWWEMNRVQKIEEVYKPVIKNETQEGLAELTQEEVAELKKLNFDFNGLSADNKKICQHMHHKKKVDKLRDESISPHFDEVVNSVHIFEQGRYHHYDKQVSYYEDGDKYSKDESVIFDRLPLFTAEVVTKDNKDNNGENGEQKSKTSNLLLNHREQLQDESAEVETINVGKCRFMNPTVFSPGHAHKAVFKHKHPQGTEFKIGTEICRDHYYGPLSRWLKQHKQSVDLHFLLSDSMFICPENVCAKHFIHSDSDHKTTLRVTGTSSDVVLYENHLLQDNATLTEIAPTFVATVKEEKVASEEKMESPVTKPNQAETEQKSDATTVSVADSSAFASLEEIAKSVTQDLDLDLDLYLDDDFCDLPSQDDKEVDLLNAHQSISQPSSPKEGSEAKTTLTDKAEEFDAQQDEAKTMAAQKIKSVFATILLAKPKTGKKPANDGFHPPNLDLSNLDEIETDLLEFHEGDKLQDLQSHDSFHTPKDQQAQFSTAVHSAPLKQPKSPTSPFFDNQAAQPDNAKANARKKVQIRMCRTP